MSKIHSHAQIGALLWILSIQYYVTQLIVAAKWSKLAGYSWTTNTISDLGNTHCGLYGANNICSPLHTFMNISFIVLGMTMITGSTLLGKYYESDRVGLLGFRFMSLAGIGTILVGVFPENSVSSLHILGAALPFFFGNLSMILIGISLKNRLPKVLRGFTLISGSVGLVALVLFITRNYSMLQIGGMERVVAYPQSIWMIIFGSYIYLLGTDKSQS